VTHNYTLDRLHHLFRQPDPSSVDWLRQVRSAIDRCGLLTEQEEGGVQAIALQSPVRLEIFVAGGTLGVEMDVQHTQFIERAIDVAVSWGEQGLVKALGASQCNVELSLESQGGYPFTQRYTCSPGGLVECVRALAEASYNRYLYNRDIYSAEPDEDEGMVVPEVTVEVAFPLHPVDRQVVTLRDETGTASRDSALLIRGNGRNVGGPAYNAIVLTSTLASVTFSFAAKYDCWEIIRFEGDHQLFRLNHV